MASSLEELLEEEGFRGRRSMTRARNSLRAESFSMPLYPLHDQRKSNNTTGVRMQTGRTRSDVSRYNFEGELPTSDRVRGRRPRDDLAGREIIDEGSKKETRERFEGRGSNDVMEGKRVSVNLAADMPGNKIVEVGVEENEIYKDIYSNELYSSGRGRDTFANGIREKERYKEKSGKDAKVDKRYSNSSKHLIGRTRFSENNSKSMKQSGTSYDKSNRSSLNSKSFDDNRSQRRDNVAQALSEPALDEVAVQATISILSGYIKRFLKEEDFRTSLRDNCFSSLNFIELEEGQNTESKVISNLEQAIESVERAAEGSSNSKDLKKASLQLTVIAGLNSNDLNDGFTSGIPNSKLSACAHVYLSVIYKLQKKDRVSAKHLLQVFCNSPLQARTTLLPELWDYLFLPHLSHLKVWYSQEADSLADTSSRMRKLKLLEKVYNEILDSGTYQFAVYYKDWLTEGVEAPSIPSIRIPSVSVQKFEQGGSRSHSSEVASPVGPFSPQPMVSKRLYDAVISRSFKPGVDEMEDDAEEVNFDNCMRSSDGYSVEDKQAVTYSSATGKHNDQDIEESPNKNARDDASHSEDGLLLTAEEAWKLHEVSAPRERVLNDEVGDSHLGQSTSGNPQMLQSPPYTKANELTLQRLAQSVFELQHTDSSIDLTVSALSHSNEPIEIRSSIGELHGSSEYNDERPFFSSIPPDFICPLTGQLFEDPVTLQTGQTFERAAIKEWFDQGNRTCPVTGKTLECLVVPLTNFVLKRVIDCWKSDHCRNLLAFVSQVSGSSREHGVNPKNETAVFILEKLLTAFDKEERLTNAKHLISLGGLHFLIRRFELGNLEEKTRVAALLSCCIEADVGCRNQIARNIKKECLLDLLHSKQIEARANAVLLLTELICKNRRKDVMYFLSGLQNEGIVNTMHVLLVFLQSSPPEQRPLVAILLLHLDLLSEPRKYSIYREEAVDAITVALDGSLTDEKVRVKCCRALLILGGHFSISRKVRTENWILKQEGSDDCIEADAFDSEIGGLLFDESIPMDDEEHARQEWLRNLSASLLGNGKKSFLATISKCLGSGNLDLVRVCLITVAWLSCALTSLSNAEFQLSAFSALISRLKESLENGERVEHKILASMSLLNFSKIPECRVLLMTIAEEIVVPLRSLAEITWTAKELYAITSGEDL